MGRKLQRRGVKLAAGAAALAAVALVSPAPLSVSALDTVDMSSKWISKYNVEVPNTVPANMVDLVLCNGAAGNTSLVTQTFYQANGAYPGDLELSSFNPADGSQGRIVRSKGIDGVYHTWFSNAMHPDRFICNPDDQNAPLWLGGDVIERFGPDLVRVGIIVSTGKDNDKVQGMAAAPGYNRFIIKAATEKTDLGSNDPGYSTILRTDGPNDGKVVWSKNYQIPLLNATGNDTRMLNTKQILWHKDIGAVVLGHVYHGEMDPAQPPSDIGPNLGGVTDLFALRYGTDNGDLLAHRQFGSNNTDRILSAFSFSTLDGPRVGIVTLYNGEPNQVPNPTLVVLNGLTLETVAQGTLDISSFGSNQFQAATASNDGTYMISLAGYTTNTTNQTAFANSLSPTNLGKQLARIPLVSGNMTQFNTGVLRTGPSGNGEDSFFWVGSGGFGPKPGSGDPHPYIGKIVVKTNRKTRPLQRRQPRRRRRQLLRLFRAR